MAKKGSAGVGVKDKAVNPDLYNQWPYPMPLDDLKAYSESGRIDAAAPKAVHYLYWPDGKFIESEGKVDILVAGCGPNAAARYAYEHPNANVVGIDISEKALEHSEALKKQHDLKNLTLEKVAVEDVAKLKQKFDFVEAVGILNHLPDPLEGAKALAGTLKPDGVMTVMLFGMYPRTGIYMLQKLFKDMKLGHGPDDVETVAKTLAILDQDHVAQPYLRTSGDVKFASGLVDSFLRGIDRLYNVENCLQLAKDLDLDFMGWLDNFYYHPDGQIPIDHPVYDKIQGQPDEQKWKMMELFSGTVRKHLFYLTPKGRDKASYQPSFEGEDFLSYIPVARINNYEPPNKEKETPAMIQRMPFRPVPLDDLQLAIYSQIDAQKSVKEILDGLNIKGEPEAVTAVARNFFASLWRLGYVMFQMPKAK